MGNPLHPRSHPGSYDDAYWNERIEIMEGLLNAWGAKQETWISDEKKKWAEEHRSALERLQALTDSWTSERERWLEKQETNLKKMAGYTALRHLVGTAILLLIPIGFMAIRVNTTADELTAKANRTLALNDSMRNSFRQVYDSMQISLAESQFQTERYQRELDRFQTGFFETMRGTSQLSSAVAGQIVESRHATMDAMSASRRADSARSRVAALRDTIDGTLGSMGREIDAVTRQSLSRTYQIRAGRSEQLAGTQLLVQFRTAGNEVQDLRVVNAVTRGLVAGPANLFKGQGIPVSGNGVQYRLTLREVRPARFGTATAEFELEVVHPTS